MAEKKTEQATNKKKPEQKASSRFLALVILATGVGLCILGYTLKLRITESDYWTQVQQRLARHVTIEAKRGEIISADGKTLVSTLPEYELSIEFVATDPDTTMRRKMQEFRDTTYLQNLDSIVQGLAQIFPEKSQEWFRNRLEEGRRRGSKGWPLLHKRVTYVQYLRCKELPLLRESPNKGGFYGKRVLCRNKIYGSLASRLLGDYGEKDGVFQGKSGLEKCYDSILCGTPGRGHVIKVRSTQVTFTDIEPQDGHDLVITIDATMQDIAEKAIVNKMREIGADKGVVVLMEVATGDVKALVNMSRYGNAEAGYIFKENDYNYALNGRWEPGSTFKTGSMMVAMEDGYITPQTIVDTENGTHRFASATMNDHNAAAGRSIARVLNVTHVMMSSSNVGVSKLIDQYYHDTPEKFVDGLHRIGVGIDLGMPMGTPPNVRRPQKNKHGQYTNWSKISLPWMSIGYETSIPPISTLAFYNAIANGGKMMRPRFVTEERYQGQTVREFPPVVLKAKICSDKTLKNIHDILDSVVNAPGGTGKKAGNPKFRVCGKTGTAQMAYSKGKGARRYMVSFCGFFPSEAPKYSCIVCIEKAGLPASGGGHCGPVFREISQLVMTKGVYRNPRLLADSLSVPVPLLSTGERSETEDLLSLMKAPWTPASGEGSLATTQLAESHKGVEMKPKAQTPEDAVPDVRGMGARDAAYALRQAGFGVKLRGKGHVKEQSIPAGTKGQQGKTVTLNLG